jgi:hypothetical protein
VVLMVSRGVRDSSGVVRGLAVLAGCALFVGCGRSSAPAPRAHASGEPLAERVCDGARQAAATALGSPLSAHIVSPAAASLQCVLTGRQVRVTIDSQAGPRAYTEFDTEVAHQDQVFGPGVHEPGQIPIMITVPGSTVVVWIPTQMLVVATNATPTTGGAYVTVAVSGRAAPAKIALRVATAAAGATFAAHPNGPS